MTSETKTVVVFGSTGVQGRALIEALSSHNTSSIQWKIIALTRDAESGSSKSLAKLPFVKVTQVIKKCMDEPEKVFSELGIPKGGIHGVFSAQDFVDDVTMVKQGNAIAEAAHAHAVKHLVYSSTDAGGLRSPDIPSFYDVKLVVEEHVSTLTSLGHTYLRPVQFMDNYLPQLPSS